MIMVKRGDTLAFIARRTNENGSARTGEAAKLKAQLRNAKDELIGTFGINETEVLGDYLFKIDASLTRLFALGTYRCDIEFKDGDLVQSSPTFQISVTKDVTRDE